ncbi:SH3 domain-containing protein [Terrisporobacter vanillatitrophus]|uniref:C40 family peptidase n=1 Tax=Terrisporobacter vanillatitrophus TaxID=3058402 RepID=UPI00336605A1
MSIDKKYVLTGLVASSIMLHTGMSTAFADTEYRVITADAVNFRSGPSTSYASIGKFNKGDKVEYLGESGSWIKVKYSDKTGYVYGQYVGEYSSSTITKYVNTTVLNFRSGPSTSYSVLGTLSSGTKIEVISTSNGWSKIKYDNQTGYVSSQYLSSSAPESSSTTIKYVNTSTLNVRSGASTSYSVLGTLSSGTKIEVISTSDGWSKIKYNSQTGYVSSQYLSSNAPDDFTSTPSTSSSVSNVISLAKTLLGKPYVWGAQGPSSFDCSGFTYYVFKNAANISLPRVSRDQSNYGTYVSKSNLKAGDLIFFDTSGPNDGNVGHVGIYLGNNEFIHASSSKGQVVISQMSSYYNGAFVNARRVL